MKSRKKYCTKHPHCHNSIVFCSRHFDRSMFFDHNMDILVSHAIPIYPIYISDKKKRHAEAHDTQGSDLKKPFNLAGKLSTAELNKRYSGKLGNDGKKPDHENVGSSRGEVMVKAEGTSEACELRVKTEPVVQGEGSLRMKAEDMGLSRPGQVDVISEPTENADCEEEAVLGP